MRRYKFWTMYKLYIGGAPCVSQCSSVVFASQLESTMSEIIYQSRRYNVSLHVDCKLIFTGNAANIEYFVVRRLCMYMYRVHVHMYMYKHVQFVHILHNVHAQCTCTFLFVSNTICS